MNKKEKLKNVYEDTVSLTDNYVRNSITDKHTFDNSIYKHIIYYPSIIIENSDTVSSASKWSKDGKTCVLNMASAKNPGGGVRNGAMAQEECLFRCSNLWETVDSKFYPLKENEALYTKDAVFFKDRYYGIMDPITVDVVTVAAINLTKKDDGKVNKGKDYIDITKNKIRLMLSLAEQNGVDNIILGAWGCGVFNNDPSDMATMFKEVLDDENYATRFKNVIFAIINDHNSVGNNYEIFKKILRWN